MPKKNRDVTEMSWSPYDNATFEQYLPKFSLKNIENLVNDSESTEAPRKKVVLRCKS